MYLQIQSTIYPPDTETKAQRLSLDENQRIERKLSAICERKSCCYHTKLAADGWAKCQMRKADASGKVLFFFQSISFFAASLTA